VNGTIIPLTIILADGSKIGPHWTLDVALESARQVEEVGGGCNVVRIQKGCRDCP
jgi:hypothetical protein